MDYSLIESILLINNYLIRSRNKNSRHTIIKYMSKKISDLMSIRSRKSNNRSIDIHIPNRVNIG